MAGRKDLATMDRTPFYGSKVPPNILALKKVVGKIDRPSYAKIIRMVVSTLEQKPVQSGMFDHLVTTDLPLETVYVIYAGTLKLLRCAFRPGPAFTKEMFLLDMSTLSFPKEHVDDLASAVFGSRRGTLEAAITASKPTLPSVVDMKWKLDVAISTTSLNRVLEPVVNLQLTLSTGQVKKFEMAVSKFQELRYNVAAVLKEMDSLESRNILKIQDV